MLDVLKDIENIDKKSSDFFSKNFYEPINISSYIETMELKIKEEDTPLYKVQQQTNVIIKNLEEQNIFLKSNLKKTEDLYDLKVAELEDMRAESDELKKYNKKMKKITIIALFVSVIALLVSIAAWQFPDFDIIEIIGMLTK